MDIEDGPAACGAALAAAIENAGRETVLAIRGGEVWVPRLRRSQRTPHGASVFSPGAVYCISGGLGGLALEIARWMVAHGARRLALLDIKAPAGGALERIAQMEAAGAQVRVLECDVSDAGAVANALAALRDFGPLRGIVHTAGVVDDAMLANQSWDKFRRVLAPKAAGAWNLHAATRELPLDLFVLFSSATAVLGSPGQANYVAANASLDALAHQRRRQHLPAVSIDWGPWSEVGMAAALERRMGYVYLRGIGSFTPAQGAEAFGIAVQRGSAQVVAMPVDWPKLAVAMPLIGDLPLLEGLVPARSAGPAAEAADSRMFEALRAGPTSERSRRIHGYLRDSVAAALAMQPDALPGDANLIELGFDSLMAMGILNDFKRDLRLTLYPRELYQRPTVDALAEYAVTQFEAAHGLARAAAAAAPALANAFPVPARPAQAVGPKLRPAAFLLSSPRSGSTLLRVMLAGHSRLFCPPELHLLPFAAMAERARRLGGSYLDEGLQRAWMELTGCTAEEARRALDTFIERDAPVAEVYGAIQAMAGGRLLLEKSPTYSGSLDALRRAEAVFERAKYIHLIRHPCAVMESFVRRRFDKLLGLDGVDPYQLAEQAWTLSNRNLLEFFDSLPKERRAVLRYEDLVAEPEPAARRLCEFLDVPFEPAVLQPYEGRRMTDGVHAVSLPVGDPGFLEHSAIDASLGETWRAVRLPNALGPEAARIASVFGYELPGEAATAGPPPCETSRESFHRVRGLSLCVCEWSAGRPGGSVLCLHGILEQAAVWAPVASHLVRRGFHVFAPDLRGHGRSDHAPASLSYQMVDLLADLEQLAPHIGGGRFTLVGHSMGAALAAIYAAIRPKRVDSLVLLELPAPDETAADGRESAELISRQVECLLAPPPHPVLADASAAAERLRQAQPAMSPDLARRLAERVTEACEGGVRWRWDPLLRTRGGLEFGYTPYREILRRISCPVTLAYGAKSGFLRSSGARLIEEALPGAHRVEFDCGHHLPLEAPDAVAAVIAQSAAAVALGRSGNAGRRLE